MSSLLHRSAEPPRAPETPEERLAAWETRARPWIVIAAVVPLVGAIADFDPGPLAWAIDILFWLVFVADLVVHLRLRPGYLRTGMGIFDLAVVVLTFPWGLLFGTSRAGVIAIVRLARVARILAVSRQSPFVRRALERLGQPALYLGFAVVACSFLVYESAGAESNIDSFGDALWFSVVTVTTVGYGDEVPTAVVGRLAAVVLMLMGVALLGTVAATLSSFFRAEDTEDEEDATFAALRALREQATQVHDEVREVRAELSELRVELRRLRAADDSP